MENIRKAEARDASRIAEMIITNYRVNFFPIFRDEEYYFSELNVVDMANELLSDGSLEHIYVYDDGVVKGVIKLGGEGGTEIEKLFVEPSFQNAGIGAALLEYAVSEHRADRLYALELNTRAIRFYERHGFHLTDERDLEEGTTEYLVLMRR